MSKRRLATPESKVILTWLPDELRRASIIAAEKREQERMMLRAARARAAKRKKAK